MKFFASAALFVGVVSAAPRFGVVDVYSGSASTGAYKSAYSTDPSLPKHTIYLPTNAPPEIKLPVLIWGNGGCMADGTGFKNSLLEVASHGYIVLANGAPGGSGQTTFQMGMESLNWLDKNAGQGKYAAVDKSKVAVAGQSCGGLEAYKVGVDKRIKTIGIMNSGQFSDAATASNAKTMTKPVFYLLGGSGDIAYKNGERDFKALSGIPKWKGNMAVSTGGAAHIATWMNANGGKFATAEVNWLNWLLKGDAKSKEFFTGNGAKADGWSVESANLDKIQ